MIDAVNFFLRNKRVDSAIFLILVLIVVILQYFILAPHLKYGFADIDWAYLLNFKQLSSLYHDPFSHLLNAWRGSGVYMYQVYYIGLIEHFFGFDYRNFNITTHVFKTIAAISIYPLVLLITKRKMTAFLASVFFAVTYPSVGAMFMVITSGLYVAIIGMSIFLCWYAFIVKSNRDSLLDILVATALFVIALVLTTERMYPLIAVVVIIELFWWYRNGFSRIILKNLLRRLAPLLILIILVLLLKPSVVTIFFGNTPVILSKIADGNWQMLMNPFISLGSLFVDKDHWVIFGALPNLDPVSYFSFLTQRPLVIFSLITIFFAAFVSKNPVRFSILTLSMTAFFSVMAYVAVSHRLDIPVDKRLHYDISVLVPTLIGGYVLSFCVALFKEWLFTSKRNVLIITTVGGVVMAFVFIIITWILADWILIFYSIHRYLVVPAIGSSISIAGIATLVFDKLHRSQDTRYLSWTIFLFVPFFIVYNAGVVSNYFNYELNIVGMDAQQHIRMKSKLWSYLNNFSKSEPSVVYFDESVDYKNGYFDETTVMAGFNYWMRFRGNDIVEAKLTPAILRSNLICQEVRSMCLDKVKGYVTIQNGVKGLLYGGVFYKGEDFYAFRFVNKDIVNIRTEVVKSIGLE